MSTASKLEKRFWAKVQIDSLFGCWIWTSWINKGGYGRIRVAGRKVLAHRLSWELANGPIPEGMFVLHECDVRNCVNPAHLWLGTLADNNHDRDRKGRRKPPKGEMNPLAKLSEADVIAIRMLAAEGIMLHREIAKMYDVSASAIGLVIRRKSWTHI